MAFGSRVVAGIVRFLREFDEAHDHARTGRLPARLRPGDDRPGPDGRNCHEIS